MDYYEDAHLESDYEDRYLSDLDESDMDEGDDGCEIVGEPWIGRDGVEYVEVRKWNYEVGEWDFDTIPTSAIPDWDDY